MPAIQYCPPATSTDAHFDKHQFATKPNHPVSARFVGVHNGENGWESNCISFDNYANMSTQTKKPSGERRVKTPEWAIKNRSLQMVIAEYLLQRALGTRKKRSVIFAKTTWKMSPLEKLRFAEDILRSQLPNLEKRIEGLCAEYVSLKTAGGDRARLASLERIIAGIDTTLTINRSAGQVVAAIIYGYYRECKASVAVAAATGLRPCGIRQTLHRIWQIAKQMGFKQEPWSEYKVVPGGRVTKKERNESRKAQRALWNAAALCGTCGGQRRQNRKSCVDCSVKRAAAKERHRTR